MHPLPTSNSVSPTPAAPVDTADTCTHIERLRDLINQNTAINEKLERIHHNYNIALGAEAKGLCSIPTSLKSRVDNLVAKIAKNTDRVTDTFKKFQRQLISPYENNRMMLGLAKAIHEVHKNILLDLGDVIILVHGIKKVHRDEE